MRTTKPLSPLVTLAPVTLAPDLLLGVAAVLGVAGVLLVEATRRLTRMPAAASAWTAGSAVALALGYFLFLWDRPLTARLLPFAALPVVANWTPLFAAVVSAAVLAQRNLPRPRRLAAAGVLCGAAAFSLVRPLLGRPPVCLDRWDGPICVQTTPTTCSPAAAATLLRMYGIPATEGGMAELCLSRAGGTPWQGLYRGLSLKTAGTAHRVVVYDRGLIELLDRATGPVILSAGIDVPHPAAARLARENGWTPGVRHSVVALGLTARGTVRVLDPAAGVGREEWSPEDLSVLWDGTAIGLTPRGSRVGDGGRSWRRFEPGRRR